LGIAWSLGIRWIIVQSDSAAAIAILSNSYSLDHQHAILVMQYQISTNNNEKLFFPISTAKQTVLQIIWPVLTIMLISIYIFLICLIRVCPTGFVMTLLVFHSLKLYSTQTRIQNNDKLFHNPS
ncbi:hypothetical protein LINGRAHAP2_LOCUS28640, partial [Linum grandiflorum]